MHIWKTVPLSAWPETGKVLGSVAVGLLLLAVVAIAAYFLTARSTFTEWAPVLGAIGAWIGGSLVYGLCCFTGRTVGCLAAGSAFVRISDGGRPGPRRDAEHARQDPGPLTQLTGFRRDTTGQ